MRVFPPSSGPPPPNSGPECGRYVEEEAIDLCCRPEFVEITDGNVGEGGATSALRLIVLVEQC